MIRGTDGSEPREGGKKCFATYYLYTDPGGSMDESYLTGEPFTISKGPGSIVLSGAINGASSLAIRTTRVAADSRFPCPRTGISPSS